MMKTKLAIGFLLVVLLGLGVGSFGLYRTLSRMDCTSNLSLETARTFVRHVLQHKYKDAFQMTKNAHSGVQDPSFYSQFVASAEKQFRGIQTDTPHITLARTGQPAQSCVHRLKNISTLFGSAYQLIYHLVVMDFVDNSGRPMVLPVKVIMEQQPGGRWIIVSFETTAM